MFSKLLKHDFRAVFKYWWLGAVISVGLSVIAGLTLHIIDNVIYTKHDSIISFFHFILSFSLVGMSLLPAFTLIILLVRYNKNFFSDEGYLTFTLPVSKSLLVASKLVTGFVFSFVSYALIFINFCIVWKLCDFSEYGTVLEFIFGTGFSDLCKFAGSYAVPYIVLVVLISLALVFVNIAFVYVCVTFSAVFAKKHKVMAGVGAYLVTLGLVFALVRSVLIAVSFYSYGEVELSQIITPETGLVLLVGVLGLLIAVFGALYYLITVILNKKLNLV